MQLILEDETTLDLICAELFRAIDLDGSGKLEPGEVRSFLEGVCADVGMGGAPEERTLAAVFAELDADGSNDVSCEELRSFLRKILATQLQEVNEALAIV